MTREERHIAVLNRMLENMDVYDSIQPTTERKKAIKSAIQALSQEQTDIEQKTQEYEKAFMDGFESCSDLFTRNKEQEPCADAVSRQAVKVWLEEMDNKLNPGKYNTIAEYYAVKAQMQKLIYICDISKEKSCLNCKYNNENLYRGEHCGDCDECMLWEQEEQLPPVTQKPIECEDAVSRDELLKAIDTWDKFGYTETGCFVREPKGDYVPYIHYDDVIKCIKGMPTVTQKSGHWIHFAQGDDCSECGWSTGKYESPSKYCPNCGAKMESEVRNDNNQNV